MHARKLGSAGYRLAAMLLVGLAALAGKAALASVVEHEAGSEPGGLFAMEKLTYFESDDEFRNWVRTLRLSRSRAHGHNGMHASGVLVAASGPPGGAGVPCTDPALCPEAATCGGDVPCSRIEEVIITAAKAASPSVTNNQSAGVDEGDVVKLIGHHLVVLHEGRLFVVDVGDANVGARLRLVDRTNVYRVASDDAWYDEMVVHDRYVFVSRYSYDDGESAIDVFSLSRAGSLRREARYRIRSSDYFSGSNYALRLAGDRLVQPPSCSS